MAAGDVIGQGGKVESIPEQSRNIWAFYGELNIPIVKTLEANVALRYDDYQDVTDGRTWNPKVSRAWQPSKQVLLRASAGTGFRAPSLTEINQRRFSATGGTYSDPSVPANGERDRLRCAILRQAVSALPNSSPRLRSSGRRDWEPVPQVSLGADYWWVKVENVIGVFRPKCRFSAI